MNISLRTQYFNGMDNEYVSCVIMFVINLLQSLEIPIGIAITEDGRLELAELLEKYTIEPADVAVATFELVIDAVQSELVRDGKINPTCVCSGFDETNGGGQLN